MIHRPLLPPPAAAEPNRGMYLLLSSLVVIAVSSVGDSVDEGSGIGEVESDDWIYL